MVTWRRELLLGVIKIPWGLILSQVLYLWCLSSEWKSFASLDPCSLLAAMDLSSAFTAKLFEKVVHAYLPHFPLLSPVQWEQPTLHSSPVCKSIEFFRYHDFGVSADFNIVTSFSLGTLIGFWIPQSPGFLPIFLVISLLGKPVFYLAFLEGLVRWSSLCIWYPLLNLISEHDLSLETISKHRPGQCLFLDGSRCLNSPCPVLKTT